MKCRNCARQFLCKDFKKIDNCKDFLSFIHVKNYGEVNRLNLDNLEGSNDKRGSKKLYQ